jgi:hypothetical protein
MRSQKRNSLGEIFSILPDWIAFPVFPSDTFHIIMHLEHLDIKSVT